MFVNHYLFLPYVSRARFWWVPEALTLCLFRASTLVWANFQRQAVVRKPNGFPEGDGPGIVTKNIHRDALISWPYFGEQNVHALTTNA